MWGVMWPNLIRLPEPNIYRELGFCDSVKPSVSLFQNRLAFSMGKVSKLLSKLRKEKALIGESYVISDRGKCLLHEWFPQSYPEPDSYSVYQVEIFF